jgi:hypothetical protein
MSPQVAIMDQGVGPGHPMATVVLFLSAATFATLALYNRRHKVRVLSYFPVWLIATKTDHAYEQRSLEVVTVMSLLHAAFRDEEEEPHMNTLSCLLGGETPSLPSLSLNKTMVCALPKGALTLTDSSLRAWG